MGSLTDTVHDGFTLSGMAQVMAFVAVPMLVLPLYVVSVSVIETDVPFVFWLANDNGGVQLTLVLLVFVTMVPDAVPHLYVMVWVKLLSDRVMVRVCAVLRVPLLAVKLDALGMVFSVPVPDPLIVPMLDPLKVIENSCEKL